MNKVVNKYHNYLDQLNQIGIALSKEKDRTELLKQIITSAMALTNADAGTLYLLNKEDQLTFEIFANKTLNIEPRRVTKEDIPIGFIPLYDDEHKENLKNVASYCALRGETINIEDAYNVKDFDFSGTRAADQRLNYHSKSFLSIPLCNHENKIIGVLQLLNAKDESGNIISFSPDNVHLAESLASQAAIILTQQNLIQAQKDLFEGFIQLIAKAIDEKSAYTSNHCTRVPVLTNMIATAVNAAHSGPFKNKHFTDEELEELRIAAWLHDCGKITTLEYVVDKATKLHTLSDRIEVIELRLEIIKRDFKIALLEQRLAGLKIDADAINKDLAQFASVVQETKSFLQKVNIGGEYLSQDDKDRIHSLAEKYSYINDTDQQQPLLSPSEVENLSISRGTLNPQEREIIKNHVRVTQKMLESLPYPEHLKNVPDIAASHHEKIDGSGYPRGLTKDQMTLQARIVAIADVFEALTAADRPYKTAKSLKEATGLMEKMKEEGHIDPELFDLFMHDKIYLTYASQYLDSKQIDLT